MTQIIGFIRLQKIDSRLDQVQVRLLQIKEILHDTKAIKIILEQKLSLENRIETLKNEMSSSELEVKGLQVKIQQTESTLYSGKIINPKELQDLQLEIAMHKRQLISLENRQLELMMATEEIQKDYDIVCLKYDNAIEESNINNNTLIIEQNSLLKEIERLNSEKKAAEISLSPQDLTLYNKLRFQRGGKALSEVSEGSCNSCGATLTPSQIQAIKSFDQFIFCPSCGRVLFIN